MSFLSSGLGCMCCLLPNGHPCRGLAVVCIVVEGYQTVALVRALDVLNYCLVLLCGRPLRGLRCSVVGARYQTVTPAGALVCSVLWSWVTKRSPCRGLGFTVIDTCCHTGAFIRTFCAVHGFSFPAPGAGRPYGRKNAYGKTFLSHGSGDPYLWNKRVW